MAACHTSTCPAASVAGERERAACLLADRGALQGAPMCGRVWACVGFGGGGEGCKGMNAML